MGKEQRSRLVTTVEQIGKLGDRLKPLESLPDMLYHLENLLKESDVIGAGRHDALVGQLFEFMRLVQEWAQQQQAAPTETRYRVKVWGITIPITFVVQPPT